MESSFLAVFRCSETTVSTVEPMPIAFLCGSLQKTALLWAMFTAPRWWEMQTRQLPKWQERWLIGKLDIDWKCCVCPSSMDIHWQDERVGRSHCFLIDCYNVNLCLDPAHVYPPTRMIFLEVILYGCWSSWECMWGLSVVQRLEVVPISEVQCRNVLNVGGGQAVYPFYEGFL